MRLTIDEERCQGHTLCAMAAPELFDLRDEDGHSVLLVTGDVPAELEAAGRTAVAGCPERAISVVE